MADPLSAGLTTIKRFCLICPIANLSSLVMLFLREVFIMAWSFRSLSLQAINADILAFGAVLESR